MLSVSIQKEPDATVKAESNELAPKYKRPAESYPSIYALFQPEFKSMVDTPAGFHIKHNEKNYTLAEYTQLTKEEKGAVYVAKINNRTYKIRLRCIDNESIGYFSEGGCWMLMKKLNQKYGWEMKAIRRKGKDIHGFCLLPNGDCIDITGITKASQLLKNWDGDAVVDCPTRLQAGETIEHEPNSFMSTMRLATIFAETVHDIYLQAPTMTMKPKL